MKAKLRKEQRQRIKTSLSNIQITSSDNKSQENNNDNNNNNIIPQKKRRARNKSVEISADLLASYVIPNSKIIIKQLIKNHRLLIIY